MASRSPSKGDEAYKAIKAAGIKGQLSSIQLDVTSSDSITAAAKHIEKEHGRLDVLINNAGIASQVPSLKEQLETTFNVNVIGAALMTDAFTPLLLKSAKPYLLYVSSGLGSLSGAADKSSPHYTVEVNAYRMSKAALNMLAVQDAKLLGKQGMNVFAVCPGLVESGLRGEGEMARTAGGRAGSPEESGQTMLKIIEGARDEDVGKFVHKDGVYTW